MMQLTATDIARVRHALRREATDLRTMASGRSKENERDAMLEEAKELDALAKRFEP